MFYILEFTSDMRYIIGRKNVAADSLSRINVVTDPAVTFNDLAQAQLENLELQQLFETKSEAIRKGEINSL